MEDIKDIKWPGWNVVTLIGRGSFGAVYEIQRDVFGEIETIYLPVQGAEQLFNGRFRKASNRLLWLRT